jgi:uncharacterized membrane protein
MASVSAFLISLLGWINLRRRRAPGSAFPAGYLLLEILTAVVVALAAHLGGFLSGVNVPG